MIRLRGRSACAVVLLPLAVLLTASGALAQSAEFVATVMVGRANVHRGPSRGSPQIQTVTKGTKLPAAGLSPDKKWVRVKAPNGKVGWISRDEVAVEKNKGAAGGGATGGGAASGGGSVGGGSGKKEGSSGSGSEASGKKKKKKSGSKKGSGGSSASKSSGTGKRTGGTGGRKGASPVAKKYATVTAPRTELHLNPSTSAPTLELAMRGDVLEVGGISRDKRWVRVRTEEGTVGWIVKQDLKPGRKKALATDSGGDRPRSGGMTTRKKKKRSYATEILAEFGQVGIQEKMTSNEGLGYKLDAAGNGGGIRFERRLFGGLWVEGGYFGTANQRIPLQDEKETTLFSTLHRGDASLRYTFVLGNPDANVGLTASAGYHGYFFIVQPQTVSLFYSTAYHGGTFGGGGEVNFGKVRAYGEYRTFTPLTVEQSFGEGGEGGYGQNNTATGHYVGAGVRYRFFSGSSLGLIYRAHYYETTYTGQGKRGEDDLTGVDVDTGFEAISLVFSRGF